MAVPLSRELLHTAWSGWRADARRHPYDSLPSLHPCASRPRSREARPPHDGCATSHDRIDSGESKDLSFDIQANLHIFYVAFLRVRATPNTASSTHRPGLEFNTTRQVSSSLYLRKITFTGWGREDAGMNHRVSEAQRMAGAILIEGNILRLRTLCGFVSSVQYRWTDHRIWTRCSDGQWCTNTKVTSQGYLPKALTVLHPRGRFWIMWAPTQTLAGNASLVHRHSIQPSTLNP